MNENFRCYKHIKQSGKCILKLKLNNLLAPIPFLRIYPIEKRILALKNMKVCSTFHNCLYFILIFLIYIFFNWRLITLQYCIGFAIHQHEIKQLYSIKLLSCSWLFVAPWTVAHQAPLSTEFSRQESTGVGYHVVLLQGSSQPRDETHISCISYIGMWILYH